MKIAGRWDTLGRRGQPATLGVTMADATTAGTPPQVIFEFADLTLDTRQRAVFRGLARVPMPRLTYELLLALVEAAPALLTHEDLAARVWRGRLLSPETLSQRVLLLRRALDDNAERSRYLRGVRGMGYQLVPAVRVRPCAGVRLPAVATLASAPGEADAHAVETIDLALPAQPSIVILPFATDGDAEHVNLARGLTHDVMTRIARTRSFFVIARGTAFSFAPGLHDAREVSRKLGVRYVVQGNIQFSRTGLRVHAALADAIEGRELWAEGFQCGLDYMFETQEQITDQIVSSISNEVEMAEQQRALLETPANLDAWSAYHRGYWHMYRFNAADFEEARRCFELSARLDPNLSRTYACLSFVHWQRAFLELSADRKGELQRSLELAQQSVSLNPRDPLGHWALGRVHLLQGDMDDALGELRTSTALNPSFAVGQYTLGFALMQAGDTVHSIERADKAMRLSPYDPMGSAMMGVRAFSLALRGDYGQSAQLMSRGVRLPNAHYHLVAMAAVCEVLAGNDDAARAHFARVREAKPAYGVADFLRAFQFQQPEHTRLIGNAFGRLGRLAG